MSDCGHVPVKELSGEASTFVYLRWASPANVLRHHTSGSAAAAFNGGLLLGLLGNTSLHHARASASMADLLLINP